jgi:hypothetical protein
MSHKYKRNDRQISSLLCIFLGLANGIISCHNHKGKRKNVIPRFARKKFLKTATKIITDEQQITGHTGAMCGTTPPWEMTTSPNSLHNLFRFVNRGRTTEEKTYSSSFLIAS